MGHYTGVAFRLKVKKEATDFIDFLDTQLFCFNEQSTVRDIIPVTGVKEEIQEIVSTLGNMIRCSSYYLEQWCWCVKEDNGDYWLYESRASCQSPSIKAAKALLEGSKEFLVLEEGDILLRTIYEEGSSEDILFYGNGSFNERTGFEYHSEHGDLNDSRHPSEFKFDTETKEKDRKRQYNPCQRLEEDYTPPWNIAELDELIKENQCQKESNDWIGFGRS